MSVKDLFAQKLKHITSKLNSTQLLIVSKTRSVEEIQCYYDLGHRDFGENRVQELQEKSQILEKSCPDIRWHMIGQLQSNKVVSLLEVPHLYAIHSVGSRSLLEKLLKNEHRLKNPLQIFLQFNTSGEEEKSGLETYLEVLECARLFPVSSHFKFAGLMTMGTLRTVNFQAEALRCFQELNRLKNQLQGELGIHLKTSMGMSQDYLIAIQEHSDWIRLGTMMFTES